MTHITVTVDGARYADDVEPRMLLVHYLREVVGKTGTPIGCDTSNCGACTVLLNGESVKSCAVLAVQADGADITTIEGLANGELHPLQRAFHEMHALQCGYCTPGMLISARDLVLRLDTADERGIRLPGCVVAVGTCFHGEIGRRARQKGDSSPIDARSNGAHVRIPFGNGALGKINLHGHIGVVVRVEVEHGRLHPDFPGQIAFHTAVAKSAAVRSGG